MKILISIFINSNGVSFYKPKTKFRFFGDIKFNIWIAKTDSSFKENQIYAEKKFNKCSVIGQLENPTKILSLKIIHL